jgi:hypothetical protein
MEKKYHYTYQTKNLINNKTYIGVHSTDDLNDGYIGSGVNLKQAIKKYGKENFSLIILCFFDTREEANNEEAFLVDENWVKRKDNYNLCIGGLGGDRFTYKTKEEQDITRKKISEANKGKAFNKGFKHTEEWKQKMRIISTGKKHTDEAKKKVSEARKGKPFSEEHKLKLSEASKGKILSEETRKKMSTSRSGELHHFYGKSKYDDVKEFVIEDYKKGIHRNEIIKKYTISESYYFRLIKKTKQL